MPEPHALAPLVRTVMGGLLWLAALAAVLGLLRSIGPRLRGRLGEVRVGRTLARLLPEVRNDLILPDGRGGLNQIDHLALTPAGLLAVETKTYRGVILGQAQEATWTQVIGGRRRRFQNPLRQNFAHTQALQALNPGVAVHGLVVLAGPARFPKGLPAGACHISALPAALSVLQKGQVSEELRAAWARMLLQTRTDVAARQAHLDGLRGRFGGTSYRVSWQLVLLVFLVPLVLWPFVLQKGDRHQPTSAVGVPATPVFSEWTPASVAPTPVRPATSARYPPVARHAPKAPDPSIEWAQLSNAEVDKQTCALAVAALLVENSPENRQARDQACR